MIRPYCWTTTRNGVKMVIIEQTVATLLFLGYTIYSIYSAISFANEYEIKEAKTIGIVMGLIWIIYCLFHFGLVVVLYQGWNEKCISKCRLWFISTSIILLVHFLLFLIEYFCLPDKSMGFDPIYIHIPFMLIIAYLVWAVGAYIQEMNRTEEEVEETTEIQYS